MSYETYKLIHYSGIFLATTALAGLAFAAALAKSTGDHPWRKFAVIAHGVGLFLVLLGGFGMLARLGLTSGLPGWATGKLVIWALLGGALVVAKRAPGLALPLWLGTVGASLAAAYLALAKPF
jgi:hypothetical protein